MSFDPYEILDVSRTATVDEIRTAYKRILRQVHPDTGGNAALFRAVQEAWELLRDATRRNAYDHAQSGSSHDRNKQQRGSDQSSSSSEDFRRGYEEAAGRERFKQDQQRRRQEEAARARARWEQAREEERKAAEEQQRAQAAWEVRTRPYFAALKGLDQSDRNLHSLEGAALSGVLRVRRFANRVFPVSIVLSTLTSSMLAAYITVISQSNAYVLNAIIVGVFLLIAFMAIGSLVAYVMRRNIVRTDPLDQKLLREAFLLSHSRALSEGKPLPGRHTPTWHVPAAVVASVLIFATVGFWTAGALRTSPTEAANTGQQPVDVAANPFEGAGNPDTSAQTGLAPPLVEASGATLVYGDAGQYTVTVGKPSFSSNGDEHLIEMEYTATGPEDIYPSDACIGVEGGSDVWRIPSFAYNQPSGNKVVDGVAHWWGVMSFYAPADQNGPLLFSYNCRESEDRWGVVPSAGMPTVKIGALADNGPS